MLTLPWTGATVCEADWHWAVGLWEGEGYVLVEYRRGDRPGTYTLGMDTSDEDMLREWQSIMDLGRLVQRKPYPCHKKTIYRLCECRSAVVGEWCRIAWSYMRVLRRREQVAEVLRKYDAAPPACKPRAGMLYGRQQLRQPPQCWKGLASLDFSVGGGPGMA